MGFGVLGFRVGSGFKPWAWGVGLRAWGFGAQRFGGRVSD